MRVQSALFNFQSLLLVILLLICTSAYAHGVFPGIIDRNKDGYVSVIQCLACICHKRIEADPCMPRLFGIFWKCARIGERLSPYVSICCVVMAVSSSETVDLIKMVAHAACRSLYSFNELLQWSSCIAFIRINRLALE